MLANSADWKQDLKLLLFYYNTRPHGSTHLPPMEAMFGWQPRSFIVDSPDTDLLLSEWVIRLSKRSAAIRDYIEEELRVVISSPTPERTLTDQIIPCNSCAPTAARSARRRMNLVGKLWM